jgi:hypothetical protein
MFVTPSEKKTVCSVVVLSDHNTLSLVQSQSVVEQVRGIYRIIYSVHYAALKSLSTNANCGKRVIENSFVGRFESLKDLGQVRAGP